MAKKTIYICDGCEKEQVAILTQIQLTISGTVYEDRSGVFDLCPTCISKVQTNFPWPDRWERK